MFVIGEAAIEDDISHERFACDLARCKGACCTLPGGRGAPMEDGELDELYRAFPMARKHLSDDRRRFIDEHGIIEGAPGNFTTACVDDEDCVFVFYDEEGIAKCSLELAFLEGETRWRKPLSCHLFPIRIGKGTNDRLRYEKLHECGPARVRGNVESVPLYEFVRDALVRKYGEQWYCEFRQECQRRNGIPLPVSY